MAKIAMNIDEEATVKGEYAHLWDWYGYPFPDLQRLNPPISPKENYLAYIKREDYEWVPDTHADKVEVTPPCVPDIIACGFGGGIDSFGVKWVSNPSTPDLPAFVEHGAIMLEDICDWQSLEFPDVDSWGWEECARDFREFYADDDRSFRGAIMTGFFERMISLMGFEDAAVALYDEPAETRKFLEAVADVNIKIAQHYIDDFGCDSVLFLDDWSSQNNPFFSLDVALDVLVPPIKRFADYIHSRGALCMQHSCGNGVKLAPAMKAIGIDLWQAQGTAVDLDAALEACGDDIVLEIYHLVPDGICGDDLVEFVHDCMRPVERHRYFPELMDYEPGRCFETRIDYYKHAREMAVQGISA